LSLDRAADASTFELKNIRDFSMYALFRAESRNQPVTIAPAASSEGFNTVMPKSKRVGTRAKQTSKQSEQELPPGVKLLRTLRGSSGEIRRIAWSPDGTMLAVPSINIVHVWDTRTGNLVHALKGHKDIVYCVAWSPDGTVIATGSGDRIIRLWEAATGNVLGAWRMHRGWVNALAWSPSKLLASGAEDGGVLVWNTETGDLKYSFKGHNGNINALAWSPDGRTLASASGDDTVRLWKPDIDMTHPSVVLRGHTNWVFSLAWSPDNMSLFSASWDKTVRKWNPRTGQLLHILEGHT
jgi:WD40 repeat protein